MNNNDLEIQQLLQSDAHRAFERIYQQYYRPLCRYALRFLDDASDAEDIVQSALVRLWSRVDELKEISGLRAYLFRSIHNACLNALRDNRLKKQPLSDLDIELLELSAGTSDSHEASLEERFEGVAQAIAQLPPQSKKILELNRFEGFTYKEIAEKLNISHRTVDSHLSAAMRQLRQQLNPSLACTIMVIISML